LTRRSVRVPSVWTAFSVLKVRMSNALTERSMLSNEMFCALSLCSEPVPRMSSVWPGSCGG
jgi:hypothetical protein